MTDTPRPKATSGPTALAVAAVILVVVSGANIVNAAMPLPEAPAVVDPGPGLPQDPSVPVGTRAPVDLGPVDPGAGIDVGAGFVIHPPAGWSAVGGGDGLTVLHRSGVLLIVGGVPVLAASGSLEGIADDLDLVLETVRRAGG